MKRLPIFILVLLLLPSVAFSDAISRDGNWWQTLDRNTKLSYVLGMFDGMDMGENFSVLKYFGSGKSSRCVRQALASYNEYERKYLSNTTNDQLVDGLDKFYGDFRNRRILVEGGVWLVANEIAGTTGSKLKEMIEGWRKNANGP